MLLHTILPGKSNDQVKKSTDLTLSAVHQTNTDTLSLEGSIKSVFDFSANRISHKKP